LGSFQHKSQFGSIRVKDRSNWLRLAGNLLYVIHCLGKPKIRYSPTPVRILELNEEVEIQGPWTEEPLGFIYDGRTPVGQVHVGIVHLIELEEPLVWPREAAIDETGFAPVRDLLRKRDEFETWSQFVLEQLGGK